ncbi:lectin-like domain-containing protein [Pontibacter sp. G13]|uniref:lectin-like domain-containing protein n=1 Tax=Pontibacter sp. G13 TaxID=3074898 RepID=UPI00288ACF17|nr:gliding motility-associated C-terminal domain-containing protein [Pontibacter sp. G13]WNJ17974.1 gliding motility-associated C-terminal domain-containing protein [Pontibacter sp. G13]
MNLKLILLLGVYTLLCISARAQFSLYGDAEADTIGNCAIITPDEQYQRGAVWSNGQLNLNFPFEWKGRIFMGCNDDGADGMAFILCPFKDTVGVDGSGLGYGWLWQSLAIEFDTHYNPEVGDPPFDHMALVKAGQSNHNEAPPRAGPVAIIPGGGNAEDCQEHIFRVSWDPVADRFEVWVDCELRLEYDGNIVKDFFDNQPRVYWGFTGATGWQANEQHFCLEFANAGFNVQQELCEGAIIELEAGPGVAWDWTPGDGLSDSTIQNPMAAPLTTTRYEVVVTDECGFTYEQEYLLRPAPDTLENFFPLGQDTAFCAGDSLLLDAKGFRQRNIWQDSIIGNTFLVTEPGLYFVDMFNGCVAARDSVQIDLMEAPNLQIPEDTTLCEGEVLLLEPEPFVLDVEWQDGSTDPIFVVDTAGTYWVSSSNACGSGRDTVTVDYVANLPDVNLGNDTSLCDVNEFILAVDLPVGLFEWQDGSQTSSYRVTQTGVYYVQGTNGCSRSLDSIQVRLNNTPAVDFEGTTPFCELVGVRLAAPWPESSYMWDDGSTDSTRFVETEGTYTVTISNECGAQTVSTDAVATNCGCTIVAPTAFTPNGDGINDQFGLTYICTLQQAVIRIYNRWGNLVAESSDPAFQWDGTCDGGDCPEGTYMWSVQVEFDSDEQVVDYQRGGSIVLMR